MMGRTGAGKSTLINFFYNLCKGIKFDDPKLYAISTLHQKCNIPQYETVNTEALTNGQKSSVTQHPFEYEANDKNSKYVLKMVDCPGTADTRGVKMDEKHLTKISKFISKCGTVHAICIVLSVGECRVTTETTYFLGQLKTILPKALQDRIFICVTNTVSDSENAKQLMASQGLSSSNVFCFDSFGVTPNGDKALLESKAEASSPAVDLDLFDEVVESKVTKSNDYKNLKNSWNAGQKSYMSLISTAVKLGPHATQSMQDIATTKGTITKELLEEQAQVKSLQSKKNHLQQSQKKMENTSSQLQNAENAKSSAESHKATLYSIYQNLKNQQTTYNQTEYPGKSDTKHNTICNQCRRVCHDGCGLKYISDTYVDHLSGCACIKDGYCTVCPGKCRYNVHAHQFYRYDPVTVSYRQGPSDAVVQNAYTTYNDYSTSSYGQQVDSIKNLKQSIQNEINQTNAECSQLQTKINSMQDKICNLYKKLEDLSIAPVNYEIIKYFDELIAIAGSGEEVDKLKEERTFYLAVIEAYKKSKTNNSNNS